MGRDGPAPGSARLHRVDRLPLLRPEEQTFTAMCWTVGVTQGDPQSPCVQVRGSARRLLAAGASYADVGRRSQPRLSQAEELTWALPGTTA